MCINCCISTLLIVDQTDVWCPTEGIGASAIRADALFGRRTTMKRQDIDAAARVRCLRMLKQPPSQTCDGALLAASP